MKKALVVGSGIAGIAASIRLAVKGYQVEVFEANAYPGGKLTAIEGKGYRFDAGPSLFTLPEQVEELFQLAGQNPKEHFEYDRLEVVCHYFWEDGKKVKAWADSARFAAEVASELGVSELGIKEVLKRSAFIYEHLSPLFMHRSLHKLSTWIGPQARKAYLNLGKLGLFSTMNAFNKRHLKDPKLVQLFNRYATYNGSDPYQTPATLTIIPHLEFNLGAYFPKHGMHDISMSLYKLAVSLGVRYHFNAPVEEILVENQRACGLRVQGNVVSGDLVVNNMDMVNAYKTILKKQVQPKKLLEQPKSSSALIFYWGITQIFEEIGMHNIFFSEDYEQEFEHLFRKGTIYEDPTVYINCTSVCKPDDAPLGAMNWFTMINVPNNQGQDWDQLIAKARKNILAKLSRLLHADIEQLIDFEEILDPRSIEFKTSSAQGALYGNSSNTRFAAFLRHPNFSSQLKSLYFCGGSVHPGGGIPLALLSAKIMSEDIPDLKK